MERLYSFSLFLMQTNNGTPWDTGDGSFCPVFEKKYKIRIGSLETEPLWTVFSDSFFLLFFYLLFNI